MALSIKDLGANRLPRELSARTGETSTEAIVVALRERIARRAARRSVLDERSPDQVLEYDESGLPR